MPRNAFLCALCLLPGGCSQYYILTAPDAVAQAGGEATVVVRLQRQDPYLIAPGVKDAAMRFQVADGPERVSYTDELGYAGAPVPVPVDPGVYVLKVAHMDREGDEIAARVPVYVWQQEKAVVVVDLDCLPPKGAADATGARAALLGIRQEANILYLTRLAVSRHAAEHKRLAEQGYPDGPILLWQREYWHVVRDATFNVPRVVIETRLVSQLAGVRKVFPLLRTGVCDSDLSARTFRDAGLRCVIIGPRAGNYPNATRRSSWMELADKGM